MKRIISVLLFCTIISSFTNIFAINMDMYVNDTFVQRDIQSVGNFDMLPILDIAGELGFQCTFDGTTAVLYNALQSYTFIIGNPLVIDQYGNSYGLDIVPQIIDGKLRIPAKFFQDALHMTYTWDSITNTIFLGSDATYSWLINTPEHQAADPKYMARLYADAFIKEKTLTSYGGEMVLYHKSTYQTDSLSYYMADINYDGILDLTVADIPYQSNGVIVFTYKNGNIYPIYSPGMPYSSGVEILTLATYNGRYGIFRHRQNSVDDFAFKCISSNNDIETLLWGFHYENKRWIINDMSIGETDWYAKFNAIQPVLFYSIWDLKSMSY